MVEKQEVKQSTLPAYHSMSDLIQLRCTERCVAYWLEVPSYGEDSVGLNPHWASLQLNNSVTIFIRL